VPQKPFNSKKSFFVRHLVNCSLQPVPVPRNQQRQIMSYAFHVSVWRAFWPAIAVNSRVIFCKPSVCHLFASFFTVLTGDLPVFLLF